ncbi:MAG TPA: c-type cytochrome [Rhodocyclaceae bacterium]|nr:c-type cytochrome [Rhodocyclaceae bacterium]
MSYRTVLMIAALAVATSAAAKPRKPPPAPASAKLCESCHGIDGVATAPGVPHLDGQIPDNTVDALEKFKLGKRPSTAPQHVDPALTAEEIDALAKYYGAQKGQRPEQGTDPAKVAAAETTYNNRCAKCHQEGGRDSDHDAPLIAGQPLDYLKAQTTAFVTGKRKFPFLMDEAYQGLTADDLDRLSHYFAAQKP